MRWAGGMPSWRCHGCDVHLCQKVQPGFEKSCREMWHEAPEGKLEEKVREVQAKTRKSKEVEAKTRRRKDNPAQASPRSSKRARVQVSAARQTAPRRAGQDGGKLSLYDKHRRRTF